MSLSNHFQTRFVCEYSIRREKEEDNDIWLVKVNRSLLDIVRLVKKKRFSLDYYLVITVTPCETIVSMYSPSSYIHVTCILRIRISLYVYRIYSILVQPYPQTVLIP